MSRATLADLEPGANFIRRHIGPSETETTDMLREVGAKSLEDFIAKVVPKEIRMARPPGFAQGQGGTHRALLFAPDGGPQRGVHLHDRHGLLRHRHA